MRFVIQRRGNVCIERFKMILRIKIQKKFIIFALKKFHDAACRIFEIRDRLQSESQKDWSGNLFLHPGY